MRRNIMALAMLALAACTVQQENGNDLRMNLPPIFGGQQWEVTQRDELPGGRVCTLSAGEMDVTLRSQGHSIVQQVGTSTPLNPGDRYHVQVAARWCETPDGRFGFAESGAIVQDLMKADVAYTEVIKQIADDRGSDIKRLGNKIPLQGFGAQYRACQRFIKS